MTSSIITSKDLQGEVSFSKHFLRFVVHIPKLFDSACKDLQEFTIPVGSFEVYSSGTGEGLDMQIRVQNRTMFKIHEGKRRAEINGSLQLSTKNEDSLGLARVGHQELYNLAPTTTQAQQKRTLSLALDVSLDSCSDSEMDNFEIKTTTGYQTCAYAFDHEDITTHLDTFGGIQLHISIVYYGVTVTKELEVSKFKHYLPSLTVFTLIYLKILQTMDEFKGFDLWKMGKDFDLTLICKTKEFPCHREVMMKVSALIREALEKSQKIDKVIRLIYHLDKYPVSNNIIRGC